MLVRMLVRMHLILLCVCVCTQQSGLLMFKLCVQHDSYSNYLGIVYTMYSVYSTHTLKMMSSYVRVC